VQVGGDSRRAGDGRRQTADDRTHAVKPAGLSAMPESMPVMTACRLVVSECGSAMIACIRQQRNACRR
jgi:hypothetical protein